MQEIDNLIKMANQIADNLVFQDDAVERTADHRRDVLEAGPLLQEF